MDESREQILALVAASEGSHNEAAMASTLSLLNDDNIDKIGAVMAIISNITPKGAGAYERVLESCQNSTPQVANAVTLAWRHSSDLSDGDRSSLRPAAKLFGVHLDTDRDKMLRASSAVADYLDRQRKKLLAEAERLEKLRISVQDHDTKAVLNTPVHNRIQSSNPLATLLSTVPSNLSRFITKTGENELELSFPLTKLTELQKIGMGGAGANTLLVRLLYGGKGIFPGYCVHLSDEVRPKGAPHKPWLFSTHTEGPSKQYCFGRPNLASYQISRMLWRHLESGFLSLEDTWGRIASNVSNLAQRCPVCGRHHKEVRLLRSTVCRKHAECARTFAARDCQWHLQDVWEDPNVFDLLLTMMHATSLTGRLFLLNDCPIQDENLLEALIDRIPPMGEFEKRLTRAITKDGPEFSLKTSLTQLLGRYASRANSLADTLTWVSGSYGGFLTSAYGQLRIPGIHEDHQFFLANASPEQEQRFAAHLEAAEGDSRVLFHGTTMDRLHSILRQGLLVCSGTSLERNGAYYGDGVYMTPDPYKASAFARDISKMSWAYQLALSTGQNIDDRHEWTRAPQKIRSPYQDLGVLLACEVVGHSIPNMFSDLKIIADPGKIMVRYVFLIEPGEWLDEREIVPAIERVLGRLKAREL